MKVSPIDSTIVPLSSNSTESAPPSRPLHPKDTIESCAPVKKTPPKKKKTSVGKKIANFFIKIWLYIALAFAKMFGIKKAKRVSAARLTFQKPPEQQTTYTNPACKPYNALSYKGEEQTIREIVIILSEGFSKNPARLKQCFDRIRREDVHPLKLLELVFTTDDEKFKSDFNKLCSYYGNRDKSKRDNFTMFLRGNYKAMLSSLKSESLDQMFQQKDDAGQLRQYLPGFAKALDINYDELMKVVENVDASTHEFPWEVFIKSLVDALKNETLDLGHFVDVVELAPDYGMVSEEQETHLDNITESFINGEDIHPDWEALKESSPLAILEHLKTSKHHDWLSEKKPEPVVEREQDKGVLDKLVAWATNSSNLEPKKAIDPHREERRQLFFTELNTQLSSLQPIANAHLQMFIEKQNIASDQIKEMCENNEWDKLLKIILT